MKVVPGIRGKNGLSIVATKWSLPGKGGSTADPPPSRTSRDSSCSSWRTFLLLLEEWPIMACPFLDDHESFSTQVAGPTFGACPATTRKNTIALKHKVTVRPR